MFSGVNAISGAHDLETTMVNIIVRVFAIEKRMQHPADATLAPHWSKEEK
jgi:hypothetical protein